MTELDSRSAPDADRARAAEEGLDPELMDVLYEMALLRGGPLALELDAWRRGRKSLAEAIGRAFVELIGHRRTTYAGPSAFGPPPGDPVAGAGAGGLTPNGHRGRGRRRMAAELPEGSPPNAVLRASLSPRELEVVTGLERGQRVGAIAERLGLSHHTVRNHLKSVFHKMRVTSQVELLAKLRDPHAE